MSSATKFAVGLLLAIATTAGRAYSFPIASPGTEGRLVIVTSPNPIIATYQGNSASYSNDLYLMLDAAGDPGDDGNTANDRFLFNNHASAEGSTAVLGSFPVGTELRFRLFVQNTGNNFFTGPAARNPDVHEHARVQENWQANETLVSFEDLYNGPFDYNDLSFSFTNTATNFPPVPHGFPVNNLINTCNVDGRSIRLATSFDSPEADQITTTLVTTNLPAGRYTLTNTPGNTSSQLLEFVPNLSDIAHAYTVTYTATDNGAVPQSTTVTVTINVELANCTTPTRRGTWGELKSRYR